MIVQMCTVTPFVFCNKKLVYFMVIWSCHLNLRTVTFCLVYILTMYTLLLSLVMKPLITPHLFKSKFHFQIYKKKCCSFYILRIMQNWMLSINLTRKSAFTMFLIGMYSLSSFYVKELNENQRLKNKPSLFGFML